MLQLFDARFNKDEHGPLLFIRFNPHSFRRDGVVQKVSGSDIKQAHQVQSIREDRLCNAIRNASFGEVDTMQVLYMYYSCHSKDSAEEEVNLDLWHNPQYLQEIRSKCLPPLA